MKAMDFYRLVRLLMSIVIVLSAFVYQNVTPSTQPETGESAEA